eukprot:COSAG01_NODE_59216_length_301_cov_1.272277_1_plen_67_part_10
MQFAADSRLASAREGETVVLNVTRVGGPTTPVSVQYQSNGGTASAASGDYDDISGSVTFAQRTCTPT